MMDHPNKKDHILSTISSSCSNCAHGSKHLMKQKNISVCSETSSSSDKYDYSKEYMNENSNISSETDIKGDKITKCDIVKQFDDLISELSKSEEQEEKTSYSYDLCDIVQENMKDNLKNFNENIPFSKNYTNNSLCGVKPFQSDINPMELNGISSVLKDQSKFDCSSMSDKKQIEKSVLGTEGKISWIDSHLWSFENKKQFQKPASQVNKTTDVLTYSFKGAHLNITQPVASNSRLTETSNPSAFYAMKASMKKDVKHSGYTAVMKNDYRRFPHSEAAYKGMNVCKSDFRVKIGNTVSLLHSPRTSRSPVSKYMLPNNCFVVKLFLETRDLHLGPFPFEIYPKMSLRLLKLKVEQEHGIISSSQKWILGKCFAADNEKSLVDYNVMPGSSIILYVDNNQRICYDASKNEFIGVKNTTSKNNKIIIDNTAEDDRELNTVSESLHSKPEQIEVRELLMNNSFDSIPTHACSKTNDDFNLKSQNNQNTSLHKEQCINSASSGEICENIKSPIIKKRGLKKSTELKKKTKAVVSVLADTSRHNLDENSFFDKPKSTNFNNHIFLKENKSTPGNLLDSVETEAVYESNSNQFQEALLEDLITFQTNKSSNLKEHNQPCPFAETATISLNSPLRSSTQDIILPATSKSFPLSDILKDNLSGSSHSNISPQDSNKNLCESKNRYDDDDDYEDSSVHVAETKVNSRDEFLVEEPENLILSDVNISTEKEIIKTMHDIAVEGKFSFNDYSKIEEKNVKDLSDYSIKNVLSTENLENSYMSRLEEVEKVEISLNKIGSFESSILKPKRSVSSLIRKLSLTRKVKSLDDSSSSHNISSDKFCDDRTDEKTSNQSTLILDQSQYNDVHIEISPQNPDLLSTKDETTVQCENVIPLEDHTVHNPESIKNFELLLEIENMDIVENPTNFTCPVCFDEFESGQGVILHDCLHVFCRICLANAINYADGAIVMCPYRDDFYSCQSHLQQREIKALVSEDAYEKYLQRSIITAEGSEERSFHCKTLDCPGWCISDNAINVFHCPVCFHYNCLNCQAIHEGLNCRQYQNKLKLQQKIDQDAQKTLELLNKMIDGGKAIRCPKCDLILMKKWGCDWLKCSICQTEICWITKGPRWGPGGQGDTSGGCRCGVNGVKCHPSCTYCH